MNFNLRSGHSQDAETQYQQQYLSDVMVMLGVFTKDAMELASLYCSHSGRKSVTKQDVELALKTRAFHGETFWNRHDIQQKLAEMRQFLNEPGSDSEDEYEYEEDDYVYEDEMDEEMSELPDEEEDEMEEDFIKSECTCDLCTTLNGIQEKWNTWNPYTRNDISIRNSINQTFSVQSNTDDLDL